MAGLSTHILDTAIGTPAEGIEIELWSDDGKTLLNEAATNADGRTDEPILSPEDAENGFYELRFFVGDYLQQQTGQPPFYDMIPVRFRFDDERPHHHVPLLLSPFGYSTYRGS